MTTALRHLGVALLAASALGALHAVRDAHRHARDYHEARDPGGHVRPLPSLYDWEANGL